MSRWTTYTGAGGLVARGDTLLLVHQRRSYGVFWEVPSGYVEAGESFEEATAREVLEEAGIAVEVGPLVCTLVWEREHDRRRNVLAYFEATPLDADAVPRPQLEEDIDEAAYLDPLALGDTLHPLERPVVERRRRGPGKPFHLHADVTVRPDGTQSYRFR